MTKFLANHLKNQARPKVRRALPTTPMEPLDLKVGDAVRFYGVRTNAPVRTEVRAITEHYALCAWQGTTRGVTECAIISWRDGWRCSRTTGGHGASTDEEYRETLNALESGDLQVSHRNAIYLDISQIIRDEVVIFDDSAGATI